MKKLMIGVLVVAASVTVMAQAAEPVPGQNRMFTTGQYTLPDGKPAVILAIEVLEAKGWVVTAVTARVLPKGYTLEGGYVVTADTAVYDIFAKFKPVLVTPAVVEGVTVACPGPDPFSSIPGYRGNCINGGWQMVAK